MEFFVWFCDVCIVHFRNTTRTSWLHAECRVLSLQLSFRSTMMWGMDGFMTLAQSKPSSMTIWKRKRRTFRYLDESWMNHVGWLQQSCIVSWAFGLFYSLKMRTRRVNRGGLPWKLSLGTTSHSTIRTERSRSSRSHKVGLSPLWHALRIISFSRKTFGKWN
jgi:hypothetical protein